MGSSLKWAPGIIRHLRTDTWKFSDTIKAEGQCLLGEYSYVAISSIMGIIVHIKK